MNTTASTLVDVLERHAVERPDAIAFTFLENGEDEVTSRSFLQLRQRVRAMASWLRQHELQGSAVILLVRDGIQFIETFVACLYAGVIAVPVALPRPNRQLIVLQAITLSSKALTVLASRHETMAEMPALAAATGAARWLFVEDAHGSMHDVDSQPLPVDIAFIQYTSGSTRTPKGVVVTHANLMCNQRAICAAMGHDRSTIFVSWLPLFHDMGLIGNVMQPLYLGVRCVLMPPVAFLQRPIRWLAAISKYRGTTSGAPNFAYDLCVDRITEEQRRRLDLSSWRIAFNGSEPVRARTLERFSRAFAVSGFRRTAFFPCYGLAENTLIASGVDPGSEPVISFLGPTHATLTETGDASKQSVVSCGRPVVGTEMVIVNPDTCIPLPEGECGEIWIAGNSVASAYYLDPKETSAVFRARLANGIAREYLRSGDLGFVLSGLLFVAGRIKELIIIRGRNHYPQDLEDTAGAASTLLARGAAAAVMLESEEGSVTLVHELTREGWRVADRSQIEMDVREIVAQTHGVTVSRVVLIKPGSLPRTSSGKVRRTLCRRLIETGTFETLAAEEAT